MTERTGGDVVYEALLALDVDTIFVIASIHNLPILDAVNRRGGIRVIHVRHEQGAVHAADGYSRATGKLGVAVTSTGPGAANAAGGLFEAGFASSRVLMLTGQVESRFYGQGRAYIHEAEQQLPMLRSLTKGAWSVARVEDLGEIVLAAGRSAQTGRPGPTAVEIPVNLQYATTSVALPDLAPIVPTRPPVDRIEAAADLLRRASRPLIWAGGGVVGGGAADALQRFAERLRIPVITSTQGRGSIPEDHELSLGSTFYGPLHELVESADVVLAIGTRFQYFDSQFWTLRLGDKLIHLDVDASVIGRSYTPTVAVVADARLGIEALDAEVESTDAEPGWAKSARIAADESRSQHLDSLGPDYRSIVDIIRHHLPPDGAVVRDSTVPAYLWGDSLLPIVRPRTSMNPTSAAIGPGLPLGIGAALGRRAVSTVIHGDGGIMLSIGELSTLAQCQAPLIVLVFNDRGYGVLRNIQAATFGRPNHDVDLTTPDFVALAKSMRLPAELATSTAEFEAAFARGVAANAPYLIEVDMGALVPMHEEPSPQELIG